VDEFRDQAFDHVLTVCDNAKEACPIYPGHTNRLHHSFEDPAAAGEGERLDAFRRVRDQLRAYLKTFPA
jgi:arsenate reductase